MPAITALPGGFSPVAFCAMVAFTPEGPVPLSPGGIGAQAFPRAGPSRGPSGTGTGRRHPPQTQPRHCRIEVEPCPNPSIAADVCAGPLRSAAWCARPRPCWPKTSSCPILWWRPRTSPSARRVGAMPGQYQLSLAELKSRWKRPWMTACNPRSFSASRPRRTKRASGAYAEDGIVQEAVRRLKHRWPSLYVITDVCLCEYMSHGHCGILDPRRRGAQRPHPGTAGQDRREPCRRRCRHGGPLRHDGRPRGRHPPCPGRIRPGHGARHVLCREVRLGLLRSLPRSRRVRSGLRRPQELPDGSRQCPRSHHRSPGRPGRRRRLSHRQARRPLTWTSSARCATP